MDYLRGEVGITKSCCVLNIDHPDFVDIGGASNVSGVAELCHRIFDLQPGLHNLFQTCFRFCREMVILHQNQFRVSKYNCKRIIDFVMKHDYRLLDGIHALRANRVGLTKQFLKSQGYS